MRLNATCILFILYFIGTWGARAQESIVHIGKKIARCTSCFDELDYSAAIEHYKTILQQSQQLNYSKGIAYAALNLGQGYSDSKNYEKALHFLNLAEKEANTAHDTIAQSKILGIYSSIYYQYGMYTKSIDRAKYGVEILGTMNQSKRLVLSQLLYQIGICYEKLNQQDSAMKYWKQAFQGLMVGKSLTAFESKFICIVGSQLIHQYTISGQVPFASSYRARLMTTQKDLPLDSLPCAYLINEGKISLSKEDYMQAAKYLELAWEKAHLFQKLDELPEIAKLLKNVYIKLNNREKADYYKSQYLLVGNRAAQLNAQHLSLVFGSIAENKVKEKNRLDGWIGSLVIGVCVIVILLLVVAYCRRCRRRDLAKTGKPQFVSKKLPNENNDRDIECRKENEIKMFQLIKMFQVKDPQAVQKFDLLYPDFTVGLLAISPSLTAAELECCRFLKLNFETKEIARFANLSTRAVESRKYRIRKKLGLDTLLDLNIWMSNF